MRKPFTLFAVLGFLLISFGVGAQTVVLDGVAVGTTNPKTGKFTNLEATTSIKLGADTITDFDDINDNKVKVSSGDTADFLNNQFSSGAGISISADTDTVTISSTGSGQLTTKGDVLIHNGSIETRLPVGASGQYLTSDSSDNLIWANPPEGDQLFNSNVLLNAYRTAENGSRPVLKMVDGVVDAFVTNTGVDATASTNENYDSGNDFYEATRTGVTTIPMINLDGTNNYLSKGGDLTSNADGKKGIVSFWVDFKGGDGTNQTILSNKNGHIIVIRNPGNFMRFRLGTAANITIAQFLSTNTYTSNTGLTHFLIAWDLSATTVEMWVNGTKETLQVLTTTANETADYTETDFWVGKDEAVKKLNGDLGQVYFNNSDWLDFDTAANLAKFIDEIGNPVDLGSDGSTPTGNQPILYLNNTVSTWQNNLGYRGNFTENGTISAGTDISTSGTPNNMTLISNSQVAKTEANGANIVLFAEDLAADIVINTDVKASVSRDGGTTFTQVTLSDAGEFEKGNLLTGTVDISSQPTGTDMEWKVETLNNKFFNLHGVGLEWR